MWDIIYDQITAKLEKSIYLTLNLKNYKPRWWSGSQKGSIDYEKDEAEQRSLFWDLRAAKNPGSTVSWSDKKFEAQIKIVETKIHILS